MNDDNVNSMISYFSNEIGLAETIYDPQSGKTFFAVSKDGTKIEYKDTIRINNDDVMPLDPNDDLVKRSFIKLPSKAEPYGTEKQLLEEIQTYIKKYVVIPDRFITISAIYIMMTWLFDKFPVLPYLRVIGNYGTGKTRFLQTIGNVCFRSVFGGGSTSLASVFRLMDAYKCTFVFDEADFGKSESWSEIVKILNSGHTIGFPANRTEPVGRSKKFKISCFDIFGPKVLASRERFNDEALESRCLTQILTPTSHIKVPILLPQSYNQEVLLLKNKLLMYRLKHYSDILKYEEIGESLNMPRMKQTILAVATIAKSICNKTFDEIIEFASQYEIELQSNQTMTLEADVLIGIASLFWAKDTKEKIRMKDISDEFQNRFGRDYDESKIENFSSHEKQLSERKIGHIVRRKLHISVKRDGHGFYISTTEQKKRIESLLERYAITKEIVFGDDIPDANDSDVMTNISVPEDSDKNRKRKKRNKLKQS